MGDRLGSLGHFPHYPISSFSLSLGSRGLACWCQEFFPVCPCHQKHLWPLSGPLQGLLVKAGVTCGCLGVKTVLAHWITDFVHLIPSAGCSKITC